MDRLEERQDKDREKRATYAEVDRRDARTCRCCGRKGNPNATTTIGRIHRAHIKDASRGGALSLENLISICWICHALEHAKQLFFVGENANVLGFKFEIHEAAVIDVFGARQLPRHVSIITGAR